MTGMPPDGAVDWNGRRNHDEIRFWADYVTPDAGDYIYDDANEFGGIDDDAIFVILGDQNADPDEGDSYNFCHPSGALQRTGQRELHPGKCRRPG